MIIRYRNNHFSKYSYVVSSLLLLIASGYTSMSIVGLAFLGHCLLSVNNPFLLMPSLFLSSVLSDYFVLFNGGIDEGGISVSRIVSVIFVAFILLKGLQNSLRLNRKFLFLIIFITFANIISTLMSPLPGVEMILQILLNTIIFLLLASWKKEYDKEKLINFMIIMAVMGSIYFAFMSLFNVDDLLRYSISEGVNANSFGMALAQNSGILLGSFFWFRERKKSYIKIISLVILTGISIFILLLTGSRTAFFAVALTAVVMLLLEGVCYNKRSIFTMIPILVLGFGLYYAVSGLIDEYVVIERFTLDSILQSQGTGRIEIWEALFTYVIPENILFGVGIGAQNVKIAIAPYAGTYVNAAHNILIDLLSQVGLVGFIAYFSLFSSVLFASVKEYRKGNKFMIIPLTMYLVALFNGIGESMYTTREIWLTMGLCILMINLSKNSEGDFDNYMDIKGNSSWDNCCKNKRRVNS